MLALLVASPGTANAWGTQEVACWSAGRSVVKSYFGGNSGTVAYSVTDQTRYEIEGCGWDAGVGWRIGTSGDYTFSHWSDHYAMTSYQNPPSRYTGGYHRERNGYKVYT